MDDQERDELLREIATRDDRIEDLESELRDHAATIGTLVVGAANLRKQTTEQRREIKSLERDLDQDCDCSEANYALQGAYDELDEAVTEIEELRERLKPAKKKAKKSR